MGATCNRIAAYSGSIWGRCAGHPRSGGRSRADLGRCRADLGGRSDACLRSIRGRSRADLRPIWGRSEFDPGPIRGRCRADRFDLPWIWADLGSTSVRSGAHPGSSQVEPRPIRGRSGTVGGGGTWRWCLRRRWRARSRPLWRSRPWRSRCSAATLARALTPSRRASRSPPFAPKGAPQRQRSVCVRVCV